MDRVEKEQFVIGSISLLWGKDSAAIHKQSKSKKRLLHHAEVVPMNPVLSPLDGDPFSLAAILMRREETSPASSDW